MSGNRTDPSSPVGQTGPMQIRQAIEADRRALSVIAADLQRRPERHIAYLAEDAHSIAAEMIEEDEDWTEVTAIVEIDDEQGRDIVGWLMGSVDHDMGRVWWFGPFIEADDAGWPDVADALYGFAVDLLDGDVEEEFAPDARFTALIDWATGRGFDVDPGSAVLQLAGAVTEADATDRSIAVRPLTDADAAVVTPLHDALFPGTHTTGATIAASADDAHVRLVAEFDGEVAGYVAAELQPDGGGYIDYLGTADASRRKGVAAALVRASVAELRDRGAGDVHLTVREDNDGARALYSMLGFREERVISPVRRGFRLP